MFIFDSLVIYGQPLKKYYLIIYTSIVQSFSGENIKWKNEMVSPTDSSYYYSFPITLIKCTDGKIPKKEYN